MPTILRNFIPPTARPFLGREKLLDELGKMLSAAGPSSPIVAVTGIMGVGKTRLVAEYAQANSSLYDIVWRVHANDAATLAADYMGLALPQAAGTKLSLDQGTVIRSIKESLRKRGRWLLVFDDAIDPAMLMEYIPRPYDATGHVLIISRNPHWLDPTRVLQVPPVSLAVAIKLLTDGATHGANPAQVRALAQELGRLPGAIEMAIQYMRATRMTVGDYLRQLRKQPNTVLRGGLLYGDELRTRDLASTWQKSMERLQKEAPAGADLLTLCAFMGPKPIRLGHLRKGVQGVTANTLGISQVSVCNQGLAALQREGVAFVTEKAITLNRIYRTIIRSSLSEDEQKRWVGYAAQVLRAAYPEHPSGVRRWADYDALLSHTGAVLAQMTRLKLDDDLRADLLQRLGLYHLGKWYPRRARGCLEKAANLHCKAHIIPCHHVARDLVLAGDLSLALAEWNIADGYYLRAQKIYQRYHGGYDAALAAVVAKRGTLASSRGRFAKAKEWCEKALEIDSRANMPQPKPQPQARSQPQVSIAGTLAPAWQTVLKPEALRKKVDSLRAAKENKVERRNPDSSAILRAYGNVLLDHGRPWEHRALAEAQFTEAHKIDLIMLKAGHPFVAQDLAGLGRVREILGAYPESADHYSRALSIDQVAYGAHHPQVAVDLRNLAHAMVHDLMHSKHLFKRREYLEHLEGAKSRALRAHDIDVAALGKQHPNVAWDLVVLGQAFFAAGRLAEAEVTLNEACGIAARAYGGQHPWVADITGQWLSVIHGTWPSGTP